MTFGLAITSDLGQKHLQVIIALSDKLKSFFSSKDYGPGIKMLGIGVILLPPPPLGFEKFSKIKKPKYTKGKEIINPDGIPFLLENSLEYDIKLDYEKFRGSNDDERQKILKNEIIKSLKTLNEDYFRKYNFDIEQFQQDLEIILN